MIYYHGTTQLFEHFSLEYAYEGSALGPAVYMTDDMDDAQELYGSESSPDLNHRIGALADKLTQDDSNLSWAEAKRIASQQLNGNNRIVLSCELLTEKIAKISRNRKLNQTWIDMYDSTDGEDIIPSKEYETLNTVYNRHIGKDFYPEECEMCLDDLIKTIGTKHWEEHRNIIQEFLKELGYDAVLMQDVKAYFPIYSNGVNNFPPVTHQINHMIVFNPEHVKIVDRDVIQ